MGGLRAADPVDAPLVPARRARDRGLPAASRASSRRTRSCSRPTWRTTCPGHAALYAIALATAGLTAFYMFRLHFRTFLGESRVDAEVTRARPRAEPVDPGAARRARRALGVRRLPRPLGGAEPRAGRGPGAQQQPRELPRARCCTARTTRSRSRPSAGSPCSRSRWRALGALLAAWLYVWSPELPAQIRAALAGLHRLVANKYYVDEPTTPRIVRPLVALSENVLYRGIDAGPDRRRRGERLGAPRARLRERRAAALPVGPRAGLPVPDAARHAR